VKKKNYPVAQEAKDEIDRRHAANPPMAESVLNHGGTLKSSAMKGKAATHETILVELKNNEEKKKRKHEEKEEKRSKKKKKKDESEQADRAKGAALNALRKGLSWNESALMKCTCADLQALNCFLRGKQVERQEDGTSFPGAAATASNHAHAAAGSRRVRAAAAGGNHGHAGAAAARARAAAASERARADAGRDHVNGSAGVRMKVYGPCVLS